MKTTLFLSLLIGISFTSFGQEADSVTFRYENSAERLLNTNGKLVIGGYGEVHYHQPLNSKVRSNGSMDVHRMVMLIGYNFNERTQFVSEIEYEHVKEVYVEQAFLQYKINRYINLRAGLMLTPMGIINEYHEPTTFHGVERPLIDGKISPTTWREIGVGFSGNILPYSLKYQAYVMNGFNGYSGTAKLNGSSGLRNGRQRGAESYISSPNFAARIEYYGVGHLNLGLSGYFGNTQSTKYNGIEKNDNAALKSADSTVVGISMIGLDGRFNSAGFEFRGQLYYTAISNTDQYNKYTATGTKLNDLGSSMVGYYAEASYNILRNFSTIQNELVPFVRYEAYNTHNTVDGSIVKNKAYNNHAITTGLTWRIAKGAVIKADLQMVKSELDSKYTKVLSTGVGVTF